MRVSPASAALAFAIAAVVLGEACGPRADLPTPTPTPTPSFLACQSADLSLRFVSLGGAAMHDLARFRLVNLSGEPCVVEGYPALHVYGPSGQTPPVQIVDSLDSRMSAEFSVAAVRPVIIQVGEGADFTAEWATGATAVGKCFEATQVAVTPPGSQDALITGAQAESNPGFRMFVCDSPITVHPVIPAK